ncbi:hypothetical protein D3C75_1335150 [compost metagenome]
MKCGTVRYVGWVHLAASVRHLCAGSCRSVHDRSLCGNLIMLESMRKSDHVMDFMWKSAHVGAHCAALFSSV